MMDKASSVAAIILALSTSAKLIAETVKTVQEIREKRKGK